MDGLIGTIGQKVQNIISTHWLATFIVIVALIIFSVAMMFGWIGSASEGIAGSMSPVGLQLRDGPGENPPNTLAQGYEANPEEFCREAGTPTDDPWGFLAEQADDKEAMTNADEVDAKLVKAMASRR